MSRTTVKIIENDGQINDIAELRNSWGARRLFGLRSEKNISMINIFA
jgi:hypothetical protein